jgi:hypothetical protein
MTSEPDAVTTEEPTPPQGRSGEQPGAGRGGELPGRGRPGRRRPRALTAVSVLALVLFSLWGIGTPLIGGSALTATNEMVGLSPYFDAGFAGTEADNSFMDDTYTSELPAEILYKASLGHSAGGAQWDPYTNGGVPLGAIPNYALASPLTVPYYVLPTWLAPAYERLLEVVVAAGGCFLFLRRLKLSRPAAVTGGMVFATSAFMVVWLDFPQTRVAAFVPALFWAMERYFQERRLRDAALISIPVASMLLGGFPAVTGFALMTAAAYGVVRLAAQYPLFGLNRGGGAGFAAGRRPGAERRRILQPPQAPVKSEEPQYSSRVREVLRPAAGAALGAAAGLGLAMFQMLPFASFLGKWYTDGRAQTSSQHLDPVSLLTAVAPYAFGTVNPQKPPQFYLVTNLVESMGYLGAGAAVLVLVAFALQRSGRGLLPRGLFLFFAAATLVWAELIYLGGPPLGAMQKLPPLRALFSTNFIGRSRSVLGFLLAVLVAVGFELLLRHRASKGAAKGAARSRFGTVWAVGVGAVAAAVTAELLYLGERDSKAENKALRAAHQAGNAVHLYRHQIFYAALLIAAAVACVVLLRMAAARQNLEGYDRVWRKVRFGAAAALPLLIAGQSIGFVSQYYPKSAKATVYPVTDLQSYLAANLGGQRFASSGAGMVFGTNAAYSLRSVNGHAFTYDAFAAMVKGIPGNPMDFATYINFGPSLATADSPILDALGTKYFVAGMTDPIIGAETEAKGDGSQLLLRPGQPVTTAVPVAGRLRGVGIRAQGTVPASVKADDPDSWIEVAVRDASGALVSRSKRLTAGLNVHSVFTIPVAADAVPAGTALTATLTLHAQDPLTIAAAGGSAPALTTVAGADDGLRLVHVGTNPIYQRLNAQPRIRWAANSRVVADQDQRVSLLAAGQVPGDSVLLSADGPAASGRPASVDVTEDGTDSISTTVDARGSGYLVVADADQIGWKATVDGETVPLVAADEGVVAVPVPAGRHTVALRFAPPRGTAAYAITVLTAVVLVAVVVGEAWWTRSRRRRSGAGAVRV